MIISATANSVRDALACARRVAGLKLKHSREVLRSGGEDGLWRGHLADGTVVEVATRAHAKAEAHVLN
jgi:hypothetical protein